MRLIVLLLFGLVVSACDRQKTDAPQAPVGEAESGKGVDRSHKGRAAPATMFKDPGGGNISIGKFSGRSVLVNLWAIWCAPCVKELPTLAALEAESKGKLHVIAVSQDMAPQSAVDAFLAGKKLGRFAAYHDKEMALSDALGVQILPTTILFDAAGQEIWRYTGDLDWTSDEAKALLGEAAGN